MGFRSWVLESLFILPTNTTKLARLPFVLNVVVEVKDIGILPKGVLIHRGLRRAHQDLNF